MAVVLHKHLVERYGTEKPEMVFFLVEMKAPRRILMLLVFFLLHSRSIDI